MATDHIGGTAETASTLLQKLFIAVTSGNLGLSVLALMELIPKIAPLVSLVLMVWVGILAIRERRLSIKIKQMKVADMERDQNSMKPNSGG